MPVSSYDPGKVAVIIGAKILSGFSDDSQVSIERMTATFNESVGADGHVTRSASRDYRGTVTVTLMQSSPSNDDLTALALADEINGQGMFPLIIRDASGRTICSGDAAWVTQIASCDFSRSITNRTWTIRVATLVMSVGGNLTV